MSQSADPEDAPGQRWRATLEYHGAGFVGWQIQPRGRSVQAVVEAALARMADHPVEVTVSGRTDAGVHALGQVISFDLRTSRSPSAVRDGVNAWLPPDVACVDACEAPAGFDARHWALRKRYRYTWLDRRARSPSLADRTWHYRMSLDEQRMHQAAQALVGCHDLASFRAARCGATHTVRTVESLAVTREGYLIHLDVVGNGFLRHLVRIVAGTLTEIGAGRRQVGWMPEVLAAVDRRRAGPTAPPHGLCLMEVEYGAGPTRQRPGHDAGGGEMDDDD